MEAKELRVGNLVSHYGQIITVDGVDDIDVFIASAGDIPLHSVNPIELTPEWLEKFGFKKRMTVGHSVQYFIGMNPITRDWLFDILWLDKDEYPFYRNGHFKIRYVHQLQNLYHALTQKELVFEL